MSVIRYAAIPVLAAGMVASGGEYWPSGNEWAAVTASEAGFEPQGLSAVGEYALSNNSVSVMVLRGGRIALERYAPNWSADRKRSIASVNKSMMAIVAGMAIDEGRITGLDQPLVAFTPQWKDSDKSKITLRQLMSMTSGLDPRGYEVSDIQGDQFVINAGMPLAHAPGTNWQYNTPAYHLLFHIVERAVEEPVESYVGRKLFAPLGMANTTFVKNTYEGKTNYYRFESTARDMARFGLFAQRGGRWGEAQLVSAEFFQSAISPSQELNPAYGLLWWLNSRPGAAAAGEDGGEGTGLRFPGCPADTIAAMGAGGQLILIVPSRDVVVVRQGRPPLSRDFPAELLRRTLGALGVSK